MYRQTDVSATHIVGHGEPAPAEIGEDRLVVQGLGVDLAGELHAVLTRVQVHRITIDPRVEHCYVLVVVRVAFRGDGQRRDPRNSGQGLVVEGGGAAAGGDEFGQAGDLHEADGG